MASAQAKRITAQRTLHRLNTRKEARAKQLHTVCCPQPGFSVLGAPVPRGVRVRANKGVP